MSSSSLAALMRRNVRWSRARSRTATSSWAATASGRCSPLDGAASAASAAPNASTRDKPSRYRSFSTVDTCSACPPNATKPGSSDTDPSNVIR